MERGHDTRRAGDISTGRHARPPIIPGHAPAARHAPATATRTSPGAAELRHAHARRALRRPPSSAGGPGLRLAVHRHRRPARRPATGARHHRLSRRRRPGPGRSGRRHPGSRGRDGGHHPGLRRARAVRVQPAVQRRAHFAERRLRLPQRAVRQDPAAVVQLSRSEPDRSADDPCYGRCREAPPIYRPGPGAGAAILRAVDRHAGGAVVQQPRAHPRHRANSAARVRRVHGLRRGGPTAVHGRPGAHERAQYGPARERGWTEGRPRVRSRARRAGPLRGRHRRRAQTTAEGGARILVPVPHRLSDRQSRPGRRAVLRRAPDHRRHAHGGRVAEVQPVSRLCLPADGPIGLHHQPDVAGFRVGAAHLRDSGYPQRD